MAMLTTFRGKSLSDWQDMYSLADHIRTSIPFAFGAQATNLTIRTFPSMTTVQLLRIEEGSSIFTKQNYANARSYLLVPLSQITRFTKGAGIVVPRLTLESYILLFNKLGLGKDQVQLHSPHPEELILTPLLSVDEPGIAVSGSDIHLGEVQPTQRPENLVPDTARSAETEQIGSEQSYLDRNASGIRDPEKNLSPWQELDLANLQSILQGISRLYVQDHKGPISRLLIRGVRARGWRDIAILNRLWVHHGIRPDIDYRLNKSIPIASTDDDTANDGPTESDTQDCDRQHCIDFKPADNTKESRVDAKRLSEALIVSDTQDWYRRPENLFIPQRSARKRYVFQVPYHTHQGYENDVNGRRVWVEFDGEDSHRDKVVIMDDD